MSFGGLPIFTPRALARFLAFGRAGADEVALEFGQPAQNCEHEPPV